MVSLLARDGVNGPSLAPTFSASNKLSITVTEVNGKQPPQYPGTGSATGTLSEDGRSISGEGGQWTKQE